MDFQIDELQRLDADTSMPFSDEQMVIFLAGGQLGPSCLRRCMEIG
jgi:hypothetical protein